MTKAKLILLVAAFWTISVHASVGPSLSAPTSAIDAPRDIAYRGIIGLSVDASDTTHKIFRIRETIPVQKMGSMVLLYPQWETGSHSPTQQIAPLAGLSITAGARPIAWQRDLVNPFAFHLNVPSGVTRLDIEFQVLPALYEPKLITPRMLTVPWQKVVLYPAGFFMQNIAVQPNLTMPAGFQYATSLETAEGKTSRVTFKDVNLEDLVDAPVYAGLHYRRIDLTTSPDTPVRLNLFGDNDASLELIPELVSKIKMMVSDVPKLFHSTHYRHFDFLMSLSDVMPSGGGIEHQESTEINVSASYAQNPGEQILMANLLVHEFIHSWNGRTRVPADLWTPNLNMPMRGSLLWLYEGQTEFWANAMTARLGLRTFQQGLDALAVDASLMSNRSGRKWKSLQDSTIDALYMPGKAVNWRDWQRREDYYPEGVMLWIDVDMLMRELTGDKRSMVDFAAVFFGSGQHTRTKSTYTFADVCNSLNKIAPYDWSAYFNDRLSTYTNTHLLDGLERGGYRLIYTDQPTDYFKQHEIDLGGIDLSTSIGLVIGANGVVKSVEWEGPAFRAGISIGARLISIDNQDYRDDLLKQTIVDASISKKTIELTFNADGVMQTTKVDYFGSLRYPRLERIPGSVDRLKNLLLN